MKERTIQPVNNGLNGNITIPGDKSISHRAVMFGAIAEGKTTIKGFLPGADCLSTISCFKEMGVDIVQNGDEVTVVGKGLEGLQEPKAVLDVGNSGTTIRLMSGILANTPFSLAYKVMRLLQKTDETCNKSIKTNGCKH